MNPLDVPFIEPRFDEPWPESIPVEQLATTADGIALPPPPGEFFPGDAVDEYAAKLARAAAAKGTALDARLAPQDIEAERSILGGVLLSNDSLADVIEHVQVEDFYREQHRLIFAAMLDLFARNEAIDVITLGDELRKTGKLEAIGGPAYISSLDAFVPSTGNLVRYAKIVREKGLIRRIVAAGHKIARVGYAPVPDVGLFVDFAESEIMKAGDARSAKAFVTPKDLLKPAFDKLELLYTRQASISGLASGFVALDRMTAGFQLGDLIIVAGRPSMGKTSVVMNMAAHVAIELEKPVAVFSLEMSSEALVTRMLSCDARVDGQRIRTGQFLDSDWPKLARAADRIHRAKLFLDDTAGISAMEMRAKARRLKSKHPDLALVVVDYLQLMKGLGDSREQEISSIARGLKELARELAVPVIALSQLNRGTEKREDKRPMLSDLRESGAIEQDADLIAFVYRDEIYNPGSADQGIAEIIIGKQRNGPTGTVRLAFLRDYTRFENLADDVRGGT